MTDTLEAINCPECDQEIKFRETILHVPDGSETQLPESFGNGKKDRELAKFIANGRELNQNIEKWLGHHIGAAPQPLKEHPLLEVGQRFQVYCPACNAEVQGIRGPDRLVIWRRPWITSIGLAELVPFSNRRVILENPRDRRKRTFPFKKSKCYRALLFIAWSLPGLLFCGSAMFFGTPELKEEWFVILPVFLWFLVSAILLFVGLISLPDWWGKPEDLHVERYCPICGRRMYTWDIPVDRGYLYRCQDCGSPLVRGSAEYI